MSFMYPTQLFQLQTHLFDILRVIESYSSELMNEIESWKFISL